MGRDAFSQLLKDNLEKHERRQPSVLSEPGTFVLFVFFVAQKAWVPAFAGMSGL
jgi:hypothetical protein